jgi:predicted esterase
MFKMLIVIACLFFSIVSISAQERQPQLDELIKTHPGPERDSLIAGIVSSESEWQEVISEIRTVSFPDTVTGLTLLDSNTCIDGVARPYVIYVPSSYKPGVPTPMLVHLHGVVGRPIIDRNPDNYVGNTAIMAEAEKRGWLVLFPFGQQGATWWDEVGMTNVIALIRIAKSNFNIDDNRVYLSGLSDGASAAFLFAMIKPDDFAAFVALNGSMGGGSEDGGLSTYAVNMANSNIYATTADRDNYFPTAQMERAIAMAEKAGANILYRKLEGEHISSIADLDYSAIFDFLEKYPRDISPDTVIWETATAEFGICKWLAIDEITIDEPAAWHIDHNVSLVDSTVVIGFQPYDTFPGPGVMVASVPEGDYLARRIGLKPEDVIIRANGIMIDSLYDIDKFKSTISRGSEVSLLVKRSGSEVLLNGRVPAPRNYFIFKRDRPSALVKAVQTGNRFDVKGSRVGAFRIRLTPEMIDWDRNVIVTFNGEKIYDDKIAPDIGIMLRNFLSNRDRKSIYVNEIFLRPAKP